MGSDDFKCNFFMWRNHAVSISERLILSVLSLNIITRNKGRCIKHCNYTHLVMGLFKQVWPPKPDGEVRRSKWYKLGLTKILCMDIQWCELMIWSYTYSKRAFVLPIAYLFCSYIASRTSLQKTSFQRASLNDACVPTTTTISPTRSVEKDWTGLVSMVVDWRRREEARR